MPDEPVPINPSPDPGLDLDDGWLHIVGCQRSGTTLIQELLWYGFRIDARTEHEKSLFDARPPASGWYLSKKPPDTLRLATVFRRDPRLVVIAMLRDPRAVVTSRHQSRSDVYFSSFMRWRAHWQALRELDPHPRLLTVRYEDLVQDPDRVQDRISAWLPQLARRRPFSEYPEGVSVSERASMSLNGARPFDPSRIDAWRQHLPRVRGQVEEHPDFLAALVDAGYEPNVDWSKCLDDVAAYRQKYKETLPHALKRAETSLRFWFKTRAYLRRYSL